MRVVTRILLALAVTTTTGTALAQSIDVDSDLAGAWPPAGSVPPDGSATVYILARLGGLVANGISGAEFRVIGLPPGWSAIATPNPASFITLGDPFATVPPFRANIAFPDCAQPDENRIVLLYTVTLVATYRVSDRCLQVQVADPPTNPGFTTPILTACNPPEYTAYWAYGGEFIINPVLDHCVTVGVEAATWGGVKRLYTD